MRRKGIFYQFCICLVLCLCSSNTYAQLVLQQLTELQGLGNNNVNDIHQDKKGFLWLGTDIGLTRYDGNFFHVYNFKKPNGEPIGITNIEETEDRFLWLHCGDGSLGCFDKMRGEYIPIKQGGTPSVEICNIYASGDTLYAMMSDGLKTLSIKSMADSLELDEKVLIQLKMRNMVLEGRNHILYFIDNEKGLVIYDALSGKSLFVNDAQLGVKSHKIESIYPCGDYLFLGGRFQGIVCYNWKENKSRMIEISNNQSDYNNPSINQVLDLGNNRFAISNVRFLYELSFEGSDFISSPFQVSKRVQSERQFERLIRNRISKLYFDKDNQVLWIGTYGNGLIRHNVSSPSAYTIGLEDKIYHINNIVQDSEGYIWLATEKNGILRSRTNQLSQDTKFDSWNKVDNEGSYHMHKDAHGFLWIGSETGEIWKLNGGTQSLTKIALPEAVNNPQEEFCIKKIFMNSRNRLWVACENSIGIYDENTGEWLVHKEYIEPYGKVTNIVEDAVGHMWLGTERGIYKADVPLAIKNKINMTGGFEEAIGLTPTKVLSMHVNNYNQILVSYPDKIIRVAHDKIINHLVLSDEMPYGHITCMIDDRNGNTWAGSNENVISIHNTTSMYFTFPMSGNNPVVCRLSDAKLLWGNMPDLLFFDPVKLKDLKRKKVYITDIEVNANKVQFKDYPVYEAKELSLTKGDHVKILFSKLNYNSVQNKTVYRLLPNDTIWHENSHNEIVLEDIKAGNYTLEIMPVYPQPGGEEVTTLKLKVAYHWAFGPYAIAGYSLFVVLVAWAIFTYFNRKEARRKYYKAKHEKVKDELQELKDTQEEERRTLTMRDDVHAAVAQGLLTPLSVITASLHEMIDVKHIPLDLQQKCKLAYKSAMYIQDACNQMYNMHKQSLALTQLNVADYSPYRLMDAVVRSCQEIMFACGIRIEYQTATNEHYSVWMDYHKIEFALRNILSNSFRRARHDAIIKIQIEQEQIDNTDYCVFKITDYNKSPEQYPEDSRHDLGQDVVENIVMMHHGRIVEVNEGHERIKTSLYIPLGKSHFEDSKTVVFIEAEEEPQPIVEDVPDSKEIMKPLNVDESEIEEIKPQTKLKLLIVEDHKDIRLYLKLLFAKEYNVYLATNGKEGLELAEKLLPDMVITDVMMPVMDGFELVQNLKSNLNTCYIPIIVLTALTEDEDMMKGMELGADDYVTKPFNAELLKSKVKQLIYNRIELKKAYTNLLISTGADKVQEELDTEDKENNQDPLVTKVLELINENIQNEDFSVKKLAEMVNMSQTTLYRRIKQLTNFTLIEVVRGVRLRRAAELLKSKQCNVQEAAEAVGYNDMPTFRKHFVDFYGITPSAYSKQGDTAS